MKHSFYYEDGALCMRPMSYEDSQKYRALRNEEQNRMRFFYNAAISEEAQSAWYEKYEKDETDYMFSFYYKGQFAGGNAVYHVDFEKKTGEYGRLLVDKIHFPQKGLGSAITYATSQIAKKDLGLTMLFSEILSDNLPSLYSCLKAGFRKVDTRMNEKNLEVFYIENLL